MVERPRGDRADERLAPLGGVGLDVEQPLELRHHLLVGLLVLARDPVVEALFLHPGADVLHVLVKELDVLLLLNETARDVDLVFPRREEPRRQRLAKGLHVVVPADDRVLLQPLELVFSLAERVDLVEHGERVQAFVDGRLRRIEEGYPHLARARADPALVDRIRVALAPDLLDGRAKKLLALGVEALGRAALRVEVGLLDAGQGRDDRAHAARIPIGVGLAHAREDREERGHLGGVRSHVAPDLRGQVGVVDEPLLLVALQVRSASQLEPAPERRELGVLAKGVEVQLVGAAHHDAVELHVLRGERHLAGLDRELQILEGVERALQEVAELEHPAGRVDELALGLVEGDGLKRRRERLERSVHGNLALHRVDAELRADGDGTDPVAPRDEVTLDLNVLEHVGVRALV